MTKTFEPRLTAPAGSDTARMCGAGHFAVWMETCRPGERIVYAEAKWLPKEVAAPVLPLVRAAFDDGVILLTQQRLGGGWYRYLATRRARVMRPAARFVPRGRA